jgi:hypothetical protein
MSGRKAAARARLLCVDLSKSYLVVEEETRKNAILGRENSTVSKDID